MNKKNTLKYEQILDDYCQELSSIDSKVSYSFCEIGSRKYRLYMLTLNPNVVIQHPMLLCEGTITQCLSKIEYYVLLHNEKAKRLVEDNN